MLHTHHPMGMFSTLLRTFYQFYTSNSLQLKSKCSELHKFTMHDFVLSYLINDFINSSSFVKVICDLQAESIKESVESADFCRR